MDRVRSQDVDKSTTTVLMLSSQTNSNFLPQNQHSPQFFNPQIVSHVFVSKVEDDTSRVYKDFLS